MNSPDPLFFSHRESVEGNGFVAAISMRGRCLVAREQRDDDAGDAWVFYGVQPCGLSAEGDSLPSAFAEFRESLKDILFGLADEAPNFDQFRLAVEAFFNQTDSDTDLWLRRAEEIRSGSGEPVDQTVSSLSQRLFHENKPALSIDLKIANVLADDGNYEPSPSNNVTSGFRVAA